MRKREKREKWPSNDVAVAVYLHVADEQAQRCDPETDRELDGLDHRDAGLAGEAPDVEGGPLVCEPREPLDHVGGRDRTGQKQRVPAIEKERGSEWQ